MKCSLLVDSCRDLCQRHISRVTHARMGFQPRRVQAGLRLLSTSCPFPCPGQSHGSSRIRVRLWDTSGMLPPLLK